jgi:hypothetical protein
MHLILTLLSLLAASETLALPSPSNDVSMMAQVSQWTIRSLKRTCTPANTVCRWVFTIDTAGLEPNTPCTFRVSGLPATEADGKRQTCGVFTVTSGWSGQFGEGQGFTTFSVIDQDRKLIAWPAYTDNQAKNATLVSPDLSFAVQALAS